MALVKRYRYICHAITCNNSNVIIIDSTFLNLNERAVALKDEVTSASLSRLHFYNCISFAEGGNLFFNFNGNINLNNICVQKSQIVTDKLPLYGHFCSMRLRESNTLCSSFVSIDDSGNLNGQSLYYFEKANSSIKNSNITNSESTADSALYCAFSANSNISFCSIDDVNSSLNWGIITYKNTSGFLTYSNILNCHQNKSDNGLVYSFSSSYLTVISCSLLNNGQNAAIFAVKYSTIEIINCYGIGSIDLHGTAITSNMTTDLFSNTLELHKCLLIDNCIETTENIDYSFCHSIALEIYMAIFID